MEYWNCCSNLGDYCRRHSMDPQIDETLYVLCALKSKWISTYRIEFQINQFLWIELL